MKTKIIIHAGAAKTGSSALQAFIRANQKYFLQQGIVIPDRLLGLSNKITGEHVFALEPLITDPNPDRLVQALQTLSEKIEDGQALLLSAENLSNLGNHRHFAQALEGFDPQVVLYIRRQDDLLASAWQQWGAKVESDFNAWLIKAFRQHGDWARIIMDWESVVGKGNVKVRVFQRSDMVEGDLRHDFLHALELEAGDNSSIVFESGIVNPSYSGFITSLVQGNRNIFENSHDSKFYRMVGDLTGEHYVERDKRFSPMTRKQREAILYYFRDINQRVCASYFPGRPELFLPINHSAYQYPETEGLHDQQMQFILHLLFKLYEKSR